MSIGMIVAAAAATMMGGGDGRPDPGPRCPAVEAIGPPSPKLASSFGFALEPDGDAVLIADWDQFGVGEIYRLEQDGTLRDISLKGLLPFSDYGLSIAVDEGLLVASAPFECPTFERCSGVVYIQDAKNGVLIRELRPLEEEGMNLRFGESVDLSGGVVAVGQAKRLDALEPRGAVTLFDVETGEVLQRINEAAGAGPESAIGQELALGGGRLALWVSLTDRDAVPPGRVWVYRVEGGELEHQILDPDDDPGSFFGLSLDIEGDVLAVGAPGASAAGRSAGAVYLFDLESGGLIRRILAPEATAFDGFGATVRLQEGKLLVGAPLHSGAGENAGAAYVFDAATGRHLCTLIDEGVTETSFLGFSVVMSNGRVYAGADADSTFGNFIGSVRVFELRLPADLDGDGCVGSGDLGVLLAGWGGPAPDLDGDGVAGEGDLGIVLAAWGECR